MTEFLERIDQAAADGHLLANSAANIRVYLNTAADPIAQPVITELLDAENWAELNDRFFRTLAFGTGGLRSRTIGNVITAAEQGAGGPDGRPEHPCVGTFAMNFANISRATQGLIHYVSDWHTREQRTGRPAICIAHDTRHFSPEFAAFAAKVITELGCDAHLFAAARSTPELSFAVRHTGAAAGINLTASHNPPAYNGFKVYFADGGQIIEPHASGIIARVNAVANADYSPLPPAERGSINLLGTEIDNAYLDQLETVILDRDLVRNQPVTVVFSPLHGVGGAIVKPLLERLGVRFSVVESQANPSGWFPTVTSPNPENAEALTLALAQAEAEDADLVLATDPDADRMGAAARTADDKLELLSGNQLGALMAWYRARTLFARGVLTPDTARRGVIIKTFVTTDLQAAIARHFGLRCVETLTGFKYIGAKLEKYARADDDTLFVFGGEESYGYSGATFVRDKDANSAVAMLCEVAAYAASRRLTLHSLLDEIFTTFGCYLDRTESLTLDGAEGAAAIRGLVDSYQKSPPTNFAGHRVTGIRDFSRDAIFDSEGDRIPAEAMTIFDLEGNFRIAVRPSGTEPKIKYYLFGHVPPPLADVAAARANLTAQLDQLWNAVHQDATARLA